VLVFDELEAWSRLVDGGDVTWFVMVYRYGQLHGRRQAALNSGGGREKTDDGRCLKFEPSPDLGRGLRAEVNNKVLR
jgi:hypothetical protein